MCRRRHHCYGCRESPARGILNDEPSSSRCVGIRDCNTERARIPCKRTIHRNAHCTKSTASPHKKKDWFGLNWFGLNHAHDDDCKNTARNIKYLFANIGFFFVLLLLSKNKTKTKNKMSVGTALGTTLTHLALLPALWWSWCNRRRFWIEFSLVASVFWWSLNYHLCWDAHVCLFEDRQLLRHLDYFFAQLVFPVGLLFLFCIDVPCLKGIYLALMLNVDFVLLHLYGTTFVNVLVLLASSLLVIAVHWFVHWFVWNVPALPPFDKVDAFFGLWLSMLGVMFFFVDTRRGYGLAHSWWHTLTFLGCYFLFEARNIDRTLFIRKKTWRRWAHIVWPVVKV
jgi:hypothetical protein